MPSRITHSDLEALCDRINTITHSPSEAWVADDSGKYVAQIGNYYLSSENGGVCLYRLVSEAGSVADVFSCGHTSKRMLYIMMRAYIAGLVQATHDSKYR